MPGREYKNGENSSQGFLLFVYSLLNFIFMVTVQFKIDSYNFVVIIIFPYFPYFLFTS